MSLFAFPKVMNFKKLFEPDNDPQNWPDVINYKGKNVFLFDRFPIQNKEILSFSIEKTNSRYPQGFCIGVCDGYLKVNDDPTPRRKHSNVLFWQNSEVLDVKNIKIQVFTKQGHIIIKNIWETILYEETRYGLCAEQKIVRFEEGKKVACFVGGDQWAMGKGNGAAMYSEDIPNGKRYFCNDGDEDDDFDDIIFKVKRMNSK